ncbi:MAG: DUF6489 family protein, partial [Pseudomonadota bacterium]
MKITVNIEYSPIEARQFFGLPDVTPVNETIINAMVERSKENLETLSDPNLFWAKAMAAGGSNMEVMQALFTKA